MAQPDAAPSIPATLAASGCESEGQHYIFGERFIQPECTTCICERDGVAHCNWAFCNEGTKCDGGPCSSCMIGEQSYPVGSSLTCNCNECTCTGEGGWLSTIVLCGGTPPLLPCPQPSAAGAGETRVVYYDPTSSDPLGMQVRFSHGGCSRHPPTLRGCYLFADASHVRVWIEAEAALEDCEVPYIEERSFDIAPIRETHRRNAGRESGSVMLEIGDRTLDYTF
jgi:hypothetical protein